MKTSKTKKNKSNAKIIVLHQAHKMAEFQSLSSVPELQLGLYDTIAESQFRVCQKILEALKADPTIPVITENSPGFTVSDVSWLKRYWINAAFPEGIPKEFSQLTSEQKDYLTGYGGPEMLVVLGKLEKVEGNFLDIRHYLYLMQDQAAISKYFHSREFITLLRAEQLASSRSENQAIVVYGKSHDFTRMSRTCLPSVTVEIIDCFSQIDSDAGFQSRSSLLKNVPINCDNLREEAQILGYGEFFKNRPIREFVLPALTQPLLDHADEAYHENLGGGFILLFMLITLSYLMRKAWNYCSRPIESKAVSIISTPHIYTHPMPPGKNKIQQDQENMGSKSKTKNH